MMKKLNFAKIFGWIFLLILVGGSIFVGVNFRQIQDYFKAKNFKSSAEILQIVEKIKPTENGKQIFMRQIRNFCRRRILIKIVAIRLKKQQF